MVLPAAERVTLAYRLLLIVEPDPEPGADAAREAEIERRIARLDCGESQAIPAAEVFCPVARDSTRPMSAVLEFLPEAKFDTEMATQYYEERVPGWARDFAQNLKASARLLFASRCSSVNGLGLSTRHNPGFPYYIAYFIRGERLLVAGIGHGSRHPDYWKRHKPES